MLAFISDIQYWYNCQHPIINLLKTKLEACQKSADFT
jgi:hypothetical protein